jgi:CheY-like chemotaxis protein
LAGTVIAVVIPNILTMDSQEFRSLKGLRVLVAEDNFISQKLIYHILLQWQASPDIAANGKVAVEKASTAIYDVILMDIMMPELDGYDATRSIRTMKGSYFHDLPIFAFSATPDQDKIIECEMTGHITKSPLNKEELYAKISQYVKV